MSKNKKTLLMQVGVLFCVVAVLILVVIIIMNITNGEKTGDITVSGSAKMVGLKCEDTVLKHPVFIDVKPISQKNKIMANFANDRLSTITYQYDGIYSSEEATERARVEAEADYNLILANNYGEQVDVFSHSFMSDGDKLSLTITAKADKVGSRTAPYFLLDNTDSFPKSLEVMREAYEAKGFSCKVEDEEV